MNAIIKTELNKRNVVVAFLFLIVFLTPQVLLKNEYMLLFLRILKILFGLMAAYIFFKKRQIPDKPIIALAAFSVYYAFNTMIASNAGIENGGFVRTATSMGVSVVAVFLVGYFLTEHYRETIIGFMRYLELYICINLIITIWAYCYNHSLNPYLLGPYLLCGHKNNFATYMLFSGIISIAFMNLTNRKGESITQIVLTFLNVICLQSSTQIVAVLLMFAVFVLVKRNIIHISKITKWIVIGVYLLTDISVIHLRIIEKSRILSTALKSLLHKDSSFTFRTAKWDFSISKIKLRPVLGYGDGSFCYDSYYDETGKLISSYTHSHNLILELLICAGIIGLTLFAVYFVLNLRGVGCRNTLISKASIVALCGYLVICLMEPMKNTTQMLFLVSMYYVNKQDGKKTIPISE